MRDGENGSVGWTLDGRMARTTTPDLLSLARSMVGIDTVSTRSNLELIEFLVPLCHRAGLKTTLQEETRDGVRQFNLLASRRPIDRDTLLLATHTDTVPPGDHSLWTATGGDPFALTYRDGLLYGLGAADVKLDLLCKLLALETVRDVRLRDNVALAGTYGEETGRYGARLLVRGLRDSDGTVCPRRVLVGEPTGLRPGTAHKGYVEFRTEGSDPAPLTIPPLPCWRLGFTGIASHSSQPHRGASANGACLDALVALAGTGRTPADGAAPPFLVSVRGGDVANRVAAACEAVVAMASEPTSDQLLASAASSDGVSCTVTPVRMNTDAVWSPELSRMLLAVHSLTRSLDEKLRGFEILGFEPPYSTVNNGLIRLEDGHLSYVVDVRRVPGAIPGEALGAHEATLQSLGSMGSTPGKKISLRTERALDSEPFHAAEDSEVLAALLAELGGRGLPLNQELKSGTTEASVYQEAGMDTIIFGPGQAAGNIHRPNEHVPIHDLHLCVEIYRNLILRLCRS